MGSAFDTDYNCFNGTEAELLVQPKGILVLSSAE